MITKSQVKHIRALDDKKYRDECEEFVVEGEKMVAELLQSHFFIQHIFATKDWINNNENKLQTVVFTALEESELQRISFLQTPNKVMAIAKIPSQKKMNVSKTSLLLDTIQDPGNLGAIIRIADWFGIETIFASQHTANCYNSKVVQATMGSIFRVSIMYTSLVNVINENKNMPAYAAVINGENIINHKINQPSFIVIGNESKGISNEILQHCQHKITITKKGNAESLNAAIATGIICHSLLA